MDDQSLQIHEIGMKYDFVTRGSAVLFYTQQIIYNHIKTALCIIIIHIYLVEIHNIYVIILKKTACYTVEKGSRFRICHCPSA